MEIIQAKRELKCLYCPKPIHKGEVCYKTSQGFLHFDCMNEIDQAHEKFKREKKNDSS